MHDARPLFAKTEIFEWNFEILSVMALRSENQEQIQKRRNCPESTESSGKGTQY